MKKWLFWLSAVFLTSSVSFAAEVLQVESLTKFSTAEYPSEVRVKALNDIDLAPDINIKEGYTLTGKLVDVASPKRLKRDAKFSFMPMYYVDNNGKTTMIKEPFEGRYTKDIEIDKGQLAKSAALGVGSYFVQGLSVGYYAVEGAVKNESDNRFKSSVKSIYKHSPLSYVEKGQDIEINVHDVFGLKFKVEDEPVQEVAPGKFRAGNFEYKMELNDELKSILEGKEGETKQKILETLVLFGDIFGAKRMVKVTHNEGHLVTSFGIPLLKPLFKTMDEINKEGIKASGGFTCDPRPLDYDNVKCNLLEKIVFNKILYK